MHRHVHAHMATQDFGLATPFQRVSAIANAAGALHSPGLLCHCEHLQAGSLLSEVGMPSSAS